MSKRVFLIKKSELAPGGMRKVEPDGHEALAVYNLDGTYYATVDTCTHAKASLTDGEIDGDCVVCPVHWGQFHIPTGKATCFPAAVDIRTFPIVENGDELYVDL